MKEFRFSNVAAKTVAAAFAIAITFGLAETISSGMIAGAATAEAQVASAAKHLASPIKSRKS